MPRARIRTVALTLRYVVIDVFTDTPLAGNPLAVFTDGREVDDATMQALARETNLSETVFVLPSEIGHARIRIFTPERELPFAGHPTLGSAFVLGQPLQLTEIRLETGAGVIPVRLEREGPRVSFGWMTQPAPSWRTYERADELLAVLGVESELPVELYDLGPTHVFVALRSADEVAALRPDMQALAEFPVGVNCFAPLDGRWKTRVFLPFIGIPEDPAAGSAAGPLAVHLIRHGRLDFGQEVEIEQGAELGRPSKLYARVEGEGERIDSVEVGGSAVVVARGEFRLP
jgi:trans-2,3-dihydro-3-hydroxyanthranilate isomerase